jgi:tight adherence protein C
MDLTNPLLILLFLLLFIAVFSVLILLLRRRVRLQDRVDPSEAAGGGFEWRDLAHRIEDLAKPLGQMIPRSAEDLSKEERMLVQAGIRSRDAVFVLWGIRVMVGVGSLIAFMASGLFWNNPLIYLVLTLIAALMLPEVWLRWRVAERKRNIEWALPDFMDLAVVCVEAGLGLDQTIQRVGRELRLPHPDLGDELRLYSLETQAGRSRPEALRNLAERTGVEELRSFAAVLIQSDRFGTSVAQTLRVFSDDLRIKRRQKAEEAAAKLTVKIVPPLIFFIFPAILLVVAGPGMIAIYRTLFGALSGGGE